MTRLPYWQYSGAQPDGYMSAREVAAFLATYGQAFAAPIVTRTTVHYLGPLRAAFRSRNVDLVTPWLDLPVLDSDGELAHRYGMTSMPGLYVLGQRFQRTRRSNFLDGVGADAVAVTRHLLGRNRARQPTGSRG